MSRERKNIICGLLTLILVIMLGTSSFATSSVVALASTEAEIKPAVQLLTNAADTPGELFLRKEANQIPVGCREYDITLGVRGNPVPGVGKVDVVIVIDNSLSMSTHMTQVANIAKHIALSINEINANLVGIVSFNETATIHQFDGGSLSSKKTAWTDTISTLKAGGASNIAEGIKAAETILTGNGRSDDEDVNQTIVVLSDGIASKTLTGNESDEYVQIDAATDAIVRANAAADKGMTVFAVNLSAKVPSSVGQAGTETMVAIGKGGNIEISTYSQDPKTYNDAVYNAFSRVIFSAATNGVVTDVVDPRFEFVGFREYDESQLTVTMGSDGKEIITWNVGNVSSEEKILTYRVKTKQEYPVGTVVQGIMPTNERAYLTYTPAPKTNQISPKDFPIPDVYVAPPLAIALTDARIDMGDSITLGTGGNPGGENYMVVTGGWYVDETIKTAYPGRFENIISQDLTYKWYLASDTNMINEINPVVTPNEDTQYMVKVSDAYGCTATAAMWVRPRGQLTVSKKVQNLLDKDKDRQFDIWVLGPGGQAWTVSLKSGESKTITGLRSGTYRISETPPMNFEVVGISKNDLIVSASSPHPETTVINRRINDNWFYDETDVLNSFTASTDFNPSK